MSFGDGFDINVDGLKKAALALNSRPVGKDFDFDGIMDMVKHAAEESASDLIVNYGEWPRIRTLKGVTYCSDDDNAVSAKSIDLLREFVLSLAPEGQGERLAKIYEETGMVSTWLPLTRVNLRFSFLKVSGGPAVGVRLLYRQFCNLDKLKMIKLKQFLRPPNLPGLVLLSSGAVSGRTTTALACLNFINHTMSSQVVNLCRSDEWICEEQKSCVTKLRVGTEIKSALDGLAAARSLGASVVFFGDLETPDDFLAAVPGVNAGLLVIGACQASSVADALNMLFSAIPSSNLELARGVLSCNKVVVVNQKLAEGMDTSPPVAVYEMLYSEPSPYKENRGTVGILDGFRSIDARSIERAIQGSASSVSWDRCINTLLRDPEVKLSDQTATSLARDIGNLSSAASFSVPVRS